ncbi:urea ABC transporter permease subunit UrtC [Rhodalgimonas zhirmunskyi]|uniref:Urea ABC transporter permease subunit UrtC n=1 Tax=Rhodalgimonas zhirmunskyi TaxID=2964767 RepID=A0AAJ1UFE7_9RHOB|nr:urea ABC transporter permease subunit UrtC [Rhodoalgimonas zhirmunskyi]MDQ2094922.1 urea ABC transporter permease subunit UrtC [Rhodoalgimonas zhirmunskyi]
MKKTFIARNPSALWFLAALAIFTILVTVLSESVGAGIISTSFLKTLGKTLCLCLVAIAMDVVWGYCGILSLGHFAFFGIGGYAIGMWLMYARTEGIVVTSLQSNPLPSTPQEITDAIGTQIFGVVGSSEFPALWAFSQSLPLQLLAVVLVPGLLALVFGWLAFRSRVTGVYLSILTQAMTLALSLYFFQNDTGLRGNNGLSGLQNIPGLEDRSQATVSLWFFWASAAALAMGYILFAYVVSGKFGSVIRAIRDNEARVRFLGYHVEHYKLFVFTITAMVAGIAGALYYPQAGIINPAEIAPIASIYLAVWVAIGGRGRLYGAVIGATVVSLLSSWFTGGSAPNINLGFYEIRWTDWWLVLLGVSFVLVTLFLPKGIGGLFDALVRKPDVDRQGDYGPDKGAWRDEEGAPE